MTTILANVLSAFHTALGENWISGKSEENRMINKFRNRRCKAPGKRQRRLLPPKLIIVCYSMRFRQMNDLRRLAPLAPAFIKFRSQDFELRRPISTSKRARL